MTKLNFPRKNLQKQASLICVPRKSISPPQDSNANFPHHLTNSSQSRFGARLEKNNILEPPPIHCQFAVHPFWKKNNKNKMARKKFAKREGKKRMGRKKQDALWKVLPQGRPT